ncbi:MAG TPA: Lrp/AsnC ligand binding domain-containing protein [Actinomycetota bacterium]
MEGFVFIQTQVEQSKEAARQIAALDGILTVEIVTGAYDLVARARRNCERDLVQCLEEDIESVPGVTRVLVCPLESNALIWEMGVRQPALVGTGG